MEEKNVFNNYKNKKFIWLKFLLISSVIFIPIIIIGHAQNVAANCSFMCFPSFASILGWFGYGLSILTSIVMGIVEFAKNKSHREKTRENTELLRIYAVIVFISFYRFIIHLETIIDYPIDGFTWDGQALSLPFEIAILATLSIFMFKITNRWSNFVINTDKSLLYSCIILAIINFLLSLLEVGLIILY
jgi:hypothetical protein